MCIDCGTREDPASAGAWGRDRFFEGGYRHGESAGAPDWRFIGGIAATEEDPIYRTARDFPQNELRSPAYRVPLPPGNYTVTLHFAELWHVKPGGRVFDVLIEGRKVLDGYDAAAKVGYAAADRQPFHNVAVSDGILDIEFQARADNPSVAAIEIDTER